MLEAGREKKGKEGKVERTWSAPLASGSSRGWRRGQKLSTGRRLTPQVETQHQSHMKASTKTGLL